MKDAILKEVWAAKDRIAARYKGNVKKYMDDLRRIYTQNRASGEGAARPAQGRKRKTA